MTRPDTATKNATDVSAMFDEVSPRYDLLNDVLSVGSTRLWRIATTRAIAPRKGMRVLDLAAGTGTSSAAVASHGAHVTAADFSEGMLAEGRKRHAGNKLIEFVRADATALPFEDDSFDAATISYGLRNVNDPKKALAEMVRVVKPGGRIVVAEFSRPSSEVVNWAYTKYNRHVLPRVAGLINRDAAEAYKYLNESIEEWPAQDELATWLREAGLEHVAYRNLSGGIVALHRGFVPRVSRTKAAANAVASAEPETTPDQESEQPVSQKPSKPEASKPKVSEPKVSEPKTAAKKPAAPKSAAKKTPVKTSAGSAAKPAAKPATKPKSSSAKPTSTSTSPKKVTPSDDAALKSAATSEVKSAAKPAAARPAAQKPSEPKSTVPKAAAAQAPAARPSQTKPSPAKPSSTTPSEPKSAPAKSEPKSEAKSAAPKPAAPKKPTPKKPESNEGSAT